MSTKDNGGPAFPGEFMGVRSDIYRDHPEKKYEQGMSLRDWFAGQAMTGLLSYYGNESAESCAVVSYAFADNMLKARNQ